MSPAITLLATAIAAGYVVEYTPARGWQFWIPSHPRARAPLGYDSHRALLRLCEWVRRDGQAGEA